MENLIQKGEMEMKIMVLGTVYTNCYIVGNRETKEAIIVDPAASPEKIKDYIKEAGLNVVGILLTHGHFDHILAARELADCYSTRIYASKEEKELLKDAFMNYSRNAGLEYSMEADTYLEDQDILTLAGMHIKVIHTPGHTAGCVCYYFANHGVLLSGDTLFLESVGRTDLPTGSMEQIIRSIQDKLMVLSGDTVVFPGHGDATTISHEKKNNPYLNR